MKPTVIVVPCYNEATRLPVEEFRRFVAANAGVGLLFVDDGSKDNTLSVLEDMHRSNPDAFRTLALDSNSGKAEAVRRGVLETLQSPCEFVGYWDADLATPLDELPAFLDMFVQPPGAPEVQIIMGSRVKLLGRNIQRSTLRHYLSRVFASAASWSLDLPVYDTQCGAKIFRNGPHMRSLFEQPFISRWLFDVELLFRFLQLPNANGRGAGIYEYPLRQWIDVKGSKVKPRDFLKAFVELLRIRRAYGRR